MDVKEGWRSSNVETKHWGGKIEGGTGGYGDKRSLDLETKTLKRKQGMQSRSKTISIRSFEGKTSSRPASLECRNKT